MHNNYCICTYLMFYNCNYIWPGNFVEMYVKSQLKYFSVCKSCSNYVYVMEAQNSMMHMKWACVYSSYVRPNGN